MYRQRKQKQKRLIRENEDLIEKKNRNIDKNTQLIKNSKKNGINSLKLNLFHSEEGMLKQFLIKQRLEEQYSQYSQSVLTN